MLAEAFMLRLEAIMRNTHVASAAGRDKRFVPATLAVYPAGNPQPPSRRDKSTKDS